MTKIQNSKLYDLEERTFQFAKAVRIFGNRSQVQRYTSNGHKLCFCRLSRVS